jgi:hypothetical protein
VSITSIDSHYRLYREKKLELREGEQLRVMVSLKSQRPSFTPVTVSRSPLPARLPRSAVARSTMENAKGERVRLDRNAPLYADYAYAESFGATRRTERSPS